MASGVPHERAVLSRLGEERSSRQIAHLLFISEKTVSVHVSYIFAKLGVHSRVQAAMVLHRLTPGTEDFQPPE